MQSTQAQSKVFPRALLRNVGTENRRRNKGKTSLKLTKGLFFCKYTQTDVRYNKFWNIKGLNI